MRSSSGFTIVEVMVSVVLTVAAFLLTSSLSRDYLAAARTVSTQADAQFELLTLLKSLTREFQSSRSGVRACLLQREGGSPSDDTPALADFSCMPPSSNHNVVAPTVGIGLNVDADGVPGKAFVNTCEDYVPEELPLGRDGRHGPPKPSGEILWGGASKICPESCEAKQRPVVRKVTGANSFMTFPSAGKTNKRYDVWGAVLCASLYTDVREFQDLRSRNFRAQYINVLAMVGRGRFDIKYPVVDGNPVSYVWLTGGITLDFLDAQEASFFRCDTGQSRDECFDYD